MSREHASSPLSPKPTVCTTPLQIRLDAETAEALRQLCERDGCKPSEAVRRAIRAQAAGERALILEILAAVRAWPAAHAAAVQGGVEGAPEPEKPSGPLAGILSWTRQLDKED